MSKFNDILKIFDENVTIGKTIVINDLVLIPILKVNVNYLALDKKEDTKENANANINASPMCFLKVVGDEVSIVPLEEKSDMIGKIPAILDTITKSISITTAFKNN